MAKKKKKESAVNRELISGYAVSRRSVVIHIKGYSTNRSLR